MATEAARLKRKNPLGRKRKTDLTLTGLLMEERLRRRGAGGGLERVARLYEQDAPQEEILRRIGQYVRRWKRWVCPSVTKITSGCSRDHSVFWVD
jgi:hypothetical protein